MDLLKSEGFAHFEDNEADAYFERFEVIRKEKRLVEMIFEGKKLKQADVGYTARKA
jgi:hypothetical protein